MSTTTERTTTANAATADSDPCKVCESTAGYERVHGQLEQCRACGFVTFRDYTPESLAEIYTDDYFAGKEYPDYVGQQDALRRSMRRHLAQMARYNPRRDSLLEVGSAYGLFLDEARTEYGEVAGVDICESPTAYAREQLNLNVSCADFLGLDFGSRRFDVVCLWDTVEHLSAPEAYLEKAARLLNPDGMVFLTTGDITSFNARLRGANWRQIHPPSHLHYFSRDTITRLLERLGFKVVGIETASYYHTAYNVFASIRLRGGATGRVASLALNLIGERTARRVGVWINLGDIMFVAARLKARDGNE
ncbi:MAG TPA: class I SAM-dependent methyltransferase [Pyrinomonadaceae bacterium]|nr:class I SAM-dependent methyltransferase [Pyrinomonadaceae bacterium]